MAEAGHLLTATNINSTISISTSFNNKAAPKSAFHTFKIRASSNKNDISLRRSSKPPRRRLITISTSGSRWQGKWSCDYLLSLQDLSLEDLVEDEHNKDANVFINLCIEKHASFGFTVDGKIVTSFTRKCCTCSSPYCREINANFNVLVLSSNRANREIHLPEIGCDDPSVIYVKPGLEADLDSLVRDTIRLTTSTKDTCSESCEKSQPTVQYIGAQNAASIDKRWSRLLELKKSNV
ncbi:large ribosomal RNA subunit accumulation protein YCED homolog 2, chloroplastic isoform X2 [Momordica charantia]|uniref:Large ribosomal RNA subunit accumulation protein YCED homolog 2, chloroplastic isoform X2 n=1 Tax=Momordica charantia TaxID=3673 RepID=A0A6J1DI80_MOMCH|nr:large ribosomal RNA subunit accumulation protein YCED homolog 2, chloroplastic isoform X2 [Momordica charantia]